MTKECLNTARAIVGFSKMLDKNNLASHTIMVHKNVDDSDVYNLLAKSFSTKVDNNIKDNAIVLMNDNCLLMKMGDKFYLFNAKIGAAATSPDSNVVHVWANYSESIKMDDFVELGGNA